MWEAPQVPNLKGQGKEKARVILCYTVGAILGIELFGTYSVPFHKYDDVC